MPDLTAALFESLIGKRISIEAQGAVELWSVDAVTRREEHALRDGQPFNVYLSAPLSNNRSQGIRRGVLPDGEPVEFFAVPISASKETINFEVVFN